MNKQNWEAVRSKYVYKGPGQIIHQNRKDRGAVLNNREQYEGKCIHVN